MPKNVTYRIIRSGRKSLALIIDNNGDLVARAPLRMKTSVIEDFIRKKQHWIKEKQKQIAAFDAQHPPFRLAAGGNLLYLGKDLSIVNSDCEEIKPWGSCLLIPQNCEPQDIILWLKKEAAGILRERTAEYARRIGVRPKAVKISDARTRWGSCSSVNNLNFAWRLILCPIPIIDYVVVHELTHITHKNHGPAFWSDVEKILPHYKEMEKWLKANKKLMDALR